jgi:hypothetical protein
MAYYAKLRPAEVLAATARYERGLFRVERMGERKLDQQEALSQLRKARKSKPAKPVRYQERIRI